MTETAVADPIAPPPPVKKPRVRAWLNRLGVTAWCIATFVGLVRLYGLHNDFPMDYHPDEDTKVEQIEDDRRNFNHPLLMLEATTWLMKWEGIPREGPDETAVQKGILHAGRKTSAILAAIGATGFSLAGYYAAGWPGLILCSIAVGLCPSLQVYAHYMKEDAALISGIGVAAAGMAWAWNRKDVLAQLGGPMLAGVGAAMAVSGKYVGAMVIAGPLLVVLIAPFQRWWWIPIRLLLMAAIAAGATAAINQRAIENQEAFQNGFNREYEHGTTEHMGVTLPRPSRFIFAAARMEMQPHIQLFAIALAVSILIFCRGWGGDFVFVLFSLVCLAVLSMDAIPFHRYALPIVVLAHFLAALGAARWLMQLIKWRWIFVPATVGMIALFSWLQGARSADVNDQFIHDSRGALIEWASKNLPDRVRVVNDSYSLLQYANLHLRVLHGGGGGDMSFGPNFGPIAELRRRNLTTVVVCSSNYDRYFEPAAMGSPGEEQNFAYHRAWYEQLFREGKVLWQAKAAHPTHSFTNPDIVVYSIASPTK